MKRRDNRWLRLLVILLWMGVIFWFSARTGDESSAQSSFLAELLHLPVWVVRKGAHMTEYAILACLFAWFYDTFSRSWKWTGAVSLLSAVCYAATDECHQLFVSDRSGQLFDIGIDGGGALLGLAALGIFLAIRKNRIDKA